jgi:hypothetical protein
VVQQTNEQTAATARIAQAVNRAVQTLAADT